MKPFGMLRKNIGRLKPAILMFMVFFVTQGIVASYSSALPETKYNTSIIKKQGANSQSVIKKSGKQAALLRGTVCFDCFTAISSIHRLQSGNNSFTILLTIPARAPPLRLSRHT